MLELEKSALWQNSFGNAMFRGEKGLALLEQSFFDVRSRASYLASIIVRDVPGMTVHDLSHLDALWDTASIIAGREYQLNPAEAYVFGCAVLLHDSAMSLAAYPNGMTEIEQTAEWQDALAACSSAQDKASESDLDGVAADLKKKAIAEFLRNTHAKRAEELPLVKWPVNGGGVEFLIQNGELRTAYGHIIGQVAASHWWPLSQIEELPSRVNAATPLPAEWHVNPLKLALLLRAADAAHIDQRRAPRFLRALLRPSGHSEKHWAFQEKLGKPSIQKQFLVYTGTPFEAADSEAWWLCYDMLSAIDEELHGVRGELERFDIAPFLAIAVKGAKSPASIAQLIPTKNWKPVNTELRVSDVPFLVDLLGGQRLYGSDLTIPIREMVQNAADAVRAKRSYCDLPPEQGEVLVRLMRTEERDILEFIDNGIGMSQRVLTGPLLDFGRSFWRTAGLRREFPGLLSKRPTVTGQYGVGFFSVFMLGDKVRVTSRRFDAGAADSLTLEFQNGLKSRPLLRAPMPSESLLEGGTRISVTLGKRYDEPGGLLYKSQSNGEAILASLQDMLERICPMLNVTVSTEMAGQKKIAVKANDWLEMGYLELAQRTGKTDWDGSLKRDAQRLRFFSEDKSLGRACICARKRFHNGGVIAVGGFYAESLREIAGVLSGESATVSRDSAMPLVSGPDLRAWADEQAMLIANSKLSGEDQLHAASTVMLCGGDASALPVAILKRKFFKRAELKELLKVLSEVLVFEGTHVNYDEDDNVRPMDFRAEFQVSENLLFIPETPDPILHVEGKKWPQCIKDLYTPGRPRSCAEAFNMALSEAWGDALDVEEDVRVVGTVIGEEIIRSVQVYSRSDISGILG